MEKELYPVFSVDVCFASYAIDWILVGAKSKKDLIDNLDWNDGVIEIFETFGSFDDAMRQIEEGDYHRIKQIEGLYTDTPYKILDRCSYYE